MIHFVIGTRAQLFKMAPIMLECERRRLEWRWIYTAQHKDTMETSLAAFGLRSADYVLFDWNSEAKTMSKMWYWLSKTLWQLTRKKQILAGYTGERHIVLTHGDTITAWWGALLGKLSGCQVMHVESGLRSFNLFKPFPEEINRLITFRLSNIYACPGEWAVKNLEGFKGQKLNTFENTQLDTLLFGLSRCDMASVEMPKRNYVVASLHRYENVFDEHRLEEIVDRTEEIAQKFMVLWVQHPATKERLNKLTHLKSRLEDNPNIQLLPRLEYLAFIKLIKYSEFVITDGGGNQEELYHMGKPTLIFRNETERKEGLGSTAVISKLDRAIIDDFVAHYKEYNRNPTVLDRSPSQIIVNEIVAYG